jgi:hypothetical protein
VKQTESATSELFDAQATARAVKDREELWRIAEGRFGMRGIVSSAVPLLFIVAWGAQQIYERGVSGFIHEAQSFYLLVIGVALNGIYTSGTTEQRLRALYQIAKSHERARS